MTTSGMDSAICRHSKRCEWIALVVAFLGSLGLLADAQFASAYQSVTSSPSGPTVYGSTTLVDENGSAILLIVGLPLLLTVITSCALGFGSRRRSAELVAWIATGILAAFTLIAMLTIGLLIAPVTAGLVIACTIHQIRSTQVPT